MVCLEDAEPDAGRDERDDVADEEGERQRDRELEARALGPVLIVEGRAEKDDLAQDVADRADHAPERRYFGFGTLSMLSFNGFFY